ncbi:TorD/DmsD family molecular chaperone [Azospirillum doebereinerae]|uniref:TorD/DmsD family molecular chaperone n=1 Tax=Azospirillum doebereinerae TaxID=92933 RepID=UPI001FD119DC|nr:molecular chaperone TorD family protein [Azospirillum doebereinerae]
MNGSILERTAERLSAEPPFGLDGVTPPVPPFAPAAAGLRRLTGFHGAEPTVEFLAGLRAAPLRGGFGFMLDRDDALQAIALVDEVVSDLPDPLTEECIAPLRADFTAIHRSLGYRAHPAERDWMTGEGKPVAGLADSLRRWRQRAGLSLDGLPPDNLPLNEPPLAAGPAPDHLVSELDLLATLLEHGQAADATLFLDQHPLRWVPGFCSRVATRCREPFYAGVAILTAAHLDHLRDLLAGACGLPRPAEEDGDDTRRRRWTEGRLPRTCGCDS